MLYELDEEVKEVAKKKFTWLPGLSKSSLHAKTIVIDRKASFVGSMNLDQRPCTSTTRLASFSSIRKSLVKAPRNITATSRKWPSDWY